MSPHVCLRCHAPVLHHREKGWLHQDGSSSCGGATSRTVLPVLNPGGEASASDPYESTDPATQRLALTLVLVHLLTEVGPEETRRLVGIGQRDFFAGREVDAFLDAAIEHENARLPEVIRA